MTDLNEEKAFFIKAVGGQKIKLNFNEINFFRASREYVEIVTDSKTHLIHSTFKKFYEDLPEKKDFIKIHRSYIVKRSKIESIGKKYVIVKGEKLPVSATYIQNVKDFEENNIILLFD